MGNSPPALLPRFPGAWPHGTSRLSACGRGGSAAVGSKKNPVKRLVSHTCAYGLISPSASERPKVRLGAASRCRFCVTAGSYKPCPSARLAQVGRELRFCVTAGPYKPLPNYLPRRGWQRIAVLRSKMRVPKTRKQFSRQLTKRQRGKLLRTRAVTVRSARA